MLTPCEQLKNMEKSIKTRNKGQRTENSILFIRRTEQSTLIKENAVRTFTNIDSLSKGDQFTPSHFYYCEQGRLYGTGESRSHPSGGQQ